MLCVELGSVDLISMPNYNWFLFCKVTKRIYLAIAGGAADGGPRAHRDIMHHR